MIMDITVAESIVISFEIGLKIAERSKYQSSYAKIVEKFLLLDIKHQLTYSFGL